MIIKTIRHRQLKSNKILTIVKRFLSTVLFLSSFCLAKANVTDDVVSVKDTTFYEGTELPSQILKTHAEGLREFSKHLIDISKDDQSYWERDFVDSILNVVDYSGNDFSANIAKIHEAYTHAFFGASYLPAISKMIENPEEFKANGSMDRMIKASSYVHSVDSGTVSATVAFNWIYKSLYMMDYFNEFVFRADSSDVSRQLYSEMADMYAYYNKTSNMEDEAESEGVFSVYYMRAQSDMFVTISAMPIAYYKFAHPNEVVNGNNIPKDMLKIFQYGTDMDNLVDGLFTEKYDCYSVTYFNNLLKSATIIKDMLLMTSDYLDIINKAK